MDGLLLKIGDIGNHHVKAMMLRSFDTSMTRTERGRPCQIERMAIFQEYHQNQKRHFHVGCQLSDRAPHVPWKRALEQHGVKADFCQISVESHSEHGQMQYPNMLRYCFLAKPQEAF